MYICRQLESVSLPYQVVHCWWLGPPVLQIALLGLILLLFIYSSILSMLTHSINAHSSFPGQLARPSTPSLTLSEPTTQHAFIVQSVPVMRASASLVVLHALIHNRGSVTKYQLSEDMPYLIRTLHKIFLQDTVEIPAICCLMFSLVNQRSCCSCCLK